MDRYSDYSNSDGCYLDCDGCDDYRPTAIMILIDATAIMTDALSIRIEATPSLVDTITILIACLIEWYLVS